MRSFLIVCIIIASLTTSMALDCYVCSVLTGGCNDPFNKSASGVGTTGPNNTNTYCKKSSFGGIITREGTTSCTITGFVFNTGTACCQTDLCNGTHMNNPLFMILTICIAFLLAKMYWN